MVARNLTPRTPQRLEPLEIYASELTWLFSASTADSVLPYPTRRPGRPVLSVNVR